MRYFIIILILCCHVAVSSQVNQVGDNTSAIINDSLTVLRDSGNFNEIRVGTATDYVTIDENGLRMFEGATQWDDLTVSALSLAGGVQAPSLRAVLGGVASQAFNFQTANDIVYGLVQLSHGWVYADSVQAHFHCFIETTPSAGDTVVIDFEYSWSDINEVFPTTDTIQVKIPVAAWTAKQHKLVEIGWLQGATKTLSSNIIFRIERRRDLGSDTYDSTNNWWHLLDCDFHIRINKIGSDNESGD